jgi:hypothetical protein
MEPELLQSKAQAAQMAIENRLLELRSGPSITRRREIHELTDAQRLLQRLGEK